MNDPAIRFPLERRRESWPDPSRHDFPHAPFARREGDFARMKLQHWMELAETALADDPIDLDRPEDDQLLGH